MTLPIEIEASPQSQARALAVKLRGIDDAEASIAEDLAASPYTDAALLRDFVESISADVRARLGL